MNDRDSEGPVLSSRWLREPVLIFLVIAAGIFAWDAFRGAGVAEPEATQPVMKGGSVDLGTIRVTDDIRNILVEEFSWLEGREPNAEEQAALVEDWLRDEIIFRTALIQDMHLNDGKMREHLIEKIRLLWAGTVSGPSENDLLDYYADNMERYYSEPRMSFEHVYYSEEPQNPAAILSSLRSGETVEGDENFWLGSSMNNYARSILKSTFGGKFYSHLNAVALNQWVGPMMSPRGYHYVRVTERRPAAPLAYQNIRDRIRNDWEVSQLTGRIDKRTESMRENFTIIREGDDE